MTTAPYPTQPAHDTDRYWTSLANQIATQAGIPDSLLEGKTGLERYYAVLHLTSARHPDSGRYTAFVHGTAQAIVERYA